MIVTQSMTGFARRSVTTGAISVTVECRSVNNRFLDLHFRMPDALRSIENVLRDKASAYCTENLSSPFAPQTLATKPLPRLTQSAYQRCRVPWRALPTISKRPARSIGAADGPGVLIEQEQDAEALHAAAGSR